MKTDIKRLKKIIREVISEAGTSGTRGGIAVPGSSNVYGDEVWFPGHDSSYPVTRNNDEMSSQGLGSPGGAYAGNVSQDRAGDMIDDSMQDAGRPESDFALVIDSQVTRGRGGDIKDTATNNTFTVQEERSSGTLSGDLYWLWQKSGGKSANDRCIGIIETFMKHQLLQEDDIDSQLIEEIGVKGKDSKKVYSMLEYFGEFNAGMIKEARKRAKILKRKRARRI